MECKIRGQRLRDERRSHELQVYPRSLPRLAQFVEFDFDSVIQVVTIICIFQAPHGVSEPERPRVGRERRGERERQRRCRCAASGGCSVRAYYLRLPTVARHSSFVDPVRYIILAVVCTIWPTVAVGLSIMRALP